MRKTAGVLILSMLATAAVANGDGDRPHDGDGDHDRPKRVVSAPEIDPAGAFAAFTLLAGGLAVLRGRRGGK